MNTRTIMFLSVTLATMFILCLPLFAEENIPLRGAGNPSEGDLLISGRPGNSKAQLLGARLGTKTIKGVALSLYVLQAAAPGPKRPDLPNHLFSVTLQDEKDKKVIKDAVVSGVISAKGKKQQLSFGPAKPVQYEAGARLTSLDTYKVDVTFKKDNREGKASFVYKMMPAPPAHQEKAVISEKTERQ
jgi:hypothetical protein